MVEEFCGRDALYCRSVINRPAVIPANGINHGASSARVRNGLVQICFWSSTKSLMCRAKSALEDSSEATVGDILTTGSALADGADGRVPSVGALTELLSTLFCDLAFGASSTR